MIMIDLSQISTYLLENGFQLASLELLAECREKSIDPPTQLVSHFANPGQFEEFNRTNSPVDSDDAKSGSRDNWTGSGVGSGLGSSNHNSAELCRTTSSPRDGDSDQSEHRNIDHSESKGVLRFQLREANEEIALLRSKLQNLNSNTNPFEDDITSKSNDTSIDQSELDNLILEYLERKGYQFSASTMIDEGMS